jgi:DNA-binding NtrC family response regulator
VGIDDTEQQHDSGISMQRAAMGAHVVVISSPQASPTDRPPQAVSVNGATIGREGDVRVEDPRVSRAHVRLEHGATGWALTDLGSRNGGFVEGVPFSPGSSVKLFDGAVIRLGDTLLLFRSSPPALPDLREPHEPRDAKESREARDADHGEAFPGRSLAAAKIRRRLYGLAECGGHVLVLGETGTGKERVARALAPLRPGAPFIVQNCAELSRELARTELFGHLRGAFTGATANRVGLIEAADDGVLFLDELGELALDVQGELLRFLEDGTYRPLGSLELRKSSARVVAATNVELDSAVQSGKFRRDLLARLRASNAALVLPPLRERREDLLGWTLRFAAEVDPALATPAHGGPPLWSAGAVECLLLHDWPENLRELRGLVRSLLQEQVPWPITAEALSSELRGRRHRARGRREPAPPRSSLGLSGSAPPSPPTGTIPPEPAARRTPGPPGTPSAPPRPLAELTREDIVATLRAAQGNMKVAAESLCVNRRKLYRLCERLGISFEDYRPAP